MAIAYPAAAMAATRAVAQPAAAQRAAARVAQPGWAWAVAWTVAQVPMLEASGIQVQVSHSVRVALPARSATRVAALPVRAAPWSDQPQAAAGSPALS